MRNCIFPTSFNLNQVLFRGQLTKYWSTIKYENVCILPLCCSHFPLILNVAPLDDVGILKYWKVWKWMNACIVLWLHLNKMKLKKHYSCAMWQDIYTHIAKNAIFQVMKQNKAYLMWLHVTMNDNLKRLMVAQPLERHYFTLET